MLPSMDLRRSLLSGMQRGLRGLRREGKWGMTFLSVFAVTLLLQTLLFSMLGVWSVRQMLLSRGDIRIEVVPGARDSDIQGLYAALRQEPYVHMVAYVPREQAMEREGQSDPRLLEFLKKYQLQNPFPDTFSVTLATLEAYGALRTFIEQPQWKGIVHPAFLSTIATQEREAREMLRIADAAGLAVKVLLMIAFGALLLLLIELVHRRARRRKGEMRLEVLLGAMPVDVLTPFFTEMMVFLAASIALASACVLVLAGVLPMLSQTFGNATFAGFRAELWRLLWSMGPLVLIVELLLLPACAAGGTFLGTRPRVRF